MPGFRLLGPLVVEDGLGRELRPAGQARRLLAQLLLRANTPVPAPVLVEGIWGTRPTGSARVGLRGQITVLRRLVEPERRAGDFTVVVAADGGWLVRVPPGATDADRFAGAVAAGRRAAAAGRWDEAVARYRSGLAEWRGRALEDVVDDLVAARAPAARLEEERIAALESCLGAELRRGRAVEAVGELTALVDEHPYRERLVALLMLALYRTGRQADALRVYDATRRRLRDELGLSPGVELARLELAVLGHDLALEPDVDLGDPEGPARHRVGPDRGAPAGRVERGCRPPVPAAPRPCRDRVR
jgi:DNA-binding SARP family transcriptional activator